MGLLLTLPVKTWGQFQYIGAEGQVMGSPNGLSHVALSLGWLKQFSTHHGFGVEVVVPSLLRSNLDTQYLHSTYHTYEMGLIWKRHLLPFLGIRYRLFAGNSFFIGSSLHLGMVHERFFADRDYYEALGISAVYMDYSMLSPFFRLSFETGFVWNMGSRLYGTLQGRVGFQATKSRVDTYGDIDVGPNDRVRFSPYSGVNFVGGATFGIGVKL